MPTEESRIRNIDKALDAALYCFKEYGIDGTKISMVSRHSGVSVRSITRYFSTKENLILKSMERYLDSIKQSIERQFARANAGGQTGLEQLNTFLESWRTAFIDDPRLFVLVADTEMYFYKNKMNSELIERYIDHEITSKNIVKRYIEKGIADGSIKPDIEVDVSADIICSAFSGFMQRSALMRSLSPTVNDEYIARQLSTYLRKMIDDLRG